MIFYGYFNFEEKVRLSFEMMRWENILIIEYESSETNISEWKKSIHAKKTTRYGVW